MTEEQNKLAEEIERQLRNDGLRIPVEELSDASPHAMVYRRVQMPAPSWKLVIAALRADEIRALKGKGASQGDGLAKLAALPSEMQTLAESLAPEPSGEEIIEIDERGKVYPPKCAHCGQQLPLPKAIRETR